MSGHTQASMTEEIELDGHTWTVNGYLHKSHPPSRDGLEPGNREWFEACDAVNEEGSEADELTLSRLCDMVNDNLT